MKNPEISVIMPVYNREEYIREAIESILAQSFTDFEFIIVDDGSTDRTPEIVRGYRDPRIKTIYNKCNRGNYPARNRGYDCSRGNYICVMDSDDVALPERLEVQYGFLEQNPEIGIVGSDSTIIGEDDREGVMEYAPTRIRIRTIASNVMCHPTLMMRRSALETHGLRYDEGFRFVGDFDLTARAALRFPVANVPEKLLRYRHHTGQLSSQYYYVQLMYARQVILKYAREAFKMELTPDEEDIHFRLMWLIPIEEERINGMLRWVQKILERNKCVSFFDQNLLELFCVGKLKNYMGQF